ncbi:MAG TPA: class I SAM-dependent methyltransferase [Bacteroidetes bacterium]|nr:class I SAM-dependent methyltransferase [Bacteroidota bacterium]
MALRKLMPKTGKGLEIGVGTGRFAKPLGLRLGVEPSQTMSAYAQRRGVKVILGTGENLPVNTNSFDFVLIVTTICFFDDTAMAVREAARVVHPGGYVIIGMVNKISPLGRYYLKHKNDNVFYSEAKFYSVEEVVAILTQVGFRQFSMAQTIFNRLDRIKAVEPVIEGYDKGSFVVIKGLNPGNSQ